ncbi:RecD ATP-dependent exoDNAse (exonuclease V), alpha subunit - helicase superfamily I member [Comamonadaceae bacterium]
MNLLKDQFEDKVTVQRVLSQLDRGCIFAGELSDGRPIRVKFDGNDTQPLPGDTFHVKGLVDSYRNKFGKTVVQINSKHMSRVVTPGPLLRPWLERLPNVGETRAKRLLEAFGHELQAVLRDIGRADEVAKLIEPNKPALAAKITAQLYAFVAIQAGADQIRAAEVEFLTFLETVGLQESRIAGQLWRFMAGVGAVDRLTRNPYVPACLMDWKPADRMGQRLLRAANEGADLQTHPARLMGALNSVWREVLSEGDTAATEETVKSLLEKRGVNPVTTLHFAEESGSLRRIGALLRAPGAAWLEDQVVCALLAIEKTKPTITIPAGHGLESLVYDAELETGLTLTHEQHAAVVQLLTLPVAALQGGAGVGKTTVMKVLATCWERLGGDVVMSALAGKAALTLSKGASTADRPRHAYTIARLIGMAKRQASQAEDPAFKRTASDIDFTTRTLVIVDEAGMLDTPSLHKLLDLLPEGARLLFAGDEGQLPPVGIGKVFHDLVAEGSRVARLTKVLRQAADSDIPKISALVRDGQVPTLQTWSGQAKGVFIMPATKLESVQRRLRGHTELMVIAARKATVEAINESESLEARSNTTPTRRLGPLATVAIGDPVVASVNRYQDGLFNGLLGVVESIVGPEVAIKWDGEREPRSLPAAAEADIELAYGITCHRAQGSSSHAVVIVVEESRLVTREWIYTAITRSRELVILIGDVHALTMGIERRTRRTTGFRLPARSSMGLAHVGRR